MITLPVLLDWTKSGSAGPPAPCVICHLPAICRAPSGESCHKTCAEAHTATDRPADPADHFGSVA